MTMGLVKYQWMMWQKGITDTLHNTFAFAFEVGFVKEIPEWLGNNQNDIDIPKWH